MSRQRRPPMARQHALRLLGLPLLAVALGLGGCQGHPHPTSSTTFHDQQLRFAKCMRDHGVDMPDPGSGAQGAGGAGAVSAEGPDQEAFAACRTYLPKAPELAPPSAGDRERMLTFARCMRDHGVEYPDPPPVGSTGALDAGGIDMGDPTAVEALKACEPSSSSVPTKPTPER